MFGENGNAAIIGGIPTPVLKPMSCNTKTSCEILEEAPESVQVEGHKVLPSERSENKDDGGITPTKKLRPLYPTCVLW